MRLACPLMAGLALAACGGTAARGTQSSRPSAHLTVSSPAFAPGRLIPSRFTCDGQDVSLPLLWTSPPPGTRHFVVQMRDPDAPAGPFLHWSLTGIPASARRLPAGQTPAGATPGRNGFGTLGYRGPCPPPGAHAHHYVITVSAVAGDTLLASGTLIGLYARR